MKLINNQKTVLSTCTISTILVKQITHKKVPNHTFLILILSIGKVNCNCLDFLILHAPLGSLSNDNKHFISPFRLYRNRPVSFSSVVKPPAHATSHPNAGLQ